MLMQNFPIDPSLHQREKSALGARLRAALKQVEDLSVARDSLAAAHSSCDLKEAELLCKLQVLHVSSFLVCVCICVEVVH